MWPAHTYRLLSGYAVVLKLLGNLPMIPLFGTQSGFFGLASIFAPTLGFFSGASSCAFVYLVRTALSFSTTLAFASCLSHIPTLAGSLILSSESRFLPRLLAALCIGTFLVHPIGRESFLYSFYWLIPIGISFVPAPSIFLRSLSSTFITHAVGSIIFLYTRTTTSTFWQLLIAQVWIERLTYALLLTATYYAVTVCINLIKQLRSERVAHV